jgi:RNA polymerase sigma-70 factor (ECF subfamily)
MPLTGLALSEERDDLEPGPAEAAPRPFLLSAAKLRALQAEHFELLWRSLRRLGVPEADVDDAVQQVFLVAARREIQTGAERSFLFATALRVASHARRTLRRRRESGDEPPDQTDATPSPEDLVDQRRARALLDEVLETLPLDVRAVFILFELEELTVVEIAAMLGIPSGTASSRLRRGREIFQQSVARVKAAQTQRRQP